MLRAYCPNIYIFSIPPNIGTTIATTKKGKQIIKWIEEKIHVKFFHSKVWRNNSILTIVHFWRKFLSKICILTRYSWNIHSYDTDYIKLDIYKTCMYVKNEQKKVTQIKLKAFMGKIINFLAWYRLTILRKSLLSYYQNLTDDSTHQNSQLEFVFKLFDKMVRTRCLTVITYLLRNKFTFYLHSKTKKYFLKTINLYFFCGTFLITIIYRFFILLLLFSEISFIDNSFQFQDNSVSIWQIGQLSYTTQYNKYHSIH